MFKFPYGYTSPVRRTIVALPPHPLSSRRYAFSSKSKPPPPTHSALEHLQMGNSLTHLPVQWNWGATGKPQGVASEVVADKLTITSKGKQVSKNGDEENPAVHVSREGNDVVKRAAELHVVEKGDGEGPEPDEAGVVGQEAKDKMNDEKGENGQQMIDRKEGGADIEKKEAEQEDKTKDKSEQKEDTEMREADKKETNEAQHKVDDEGSENPASKLHEQPNEHAKKSEDIAAQNSETKEKQNEEEKAEETNGKRKAEDEKPEGAEDDSKKTKTSDGDVTDGGKTTGRGRGRPPKGESNGGTKAKKAKEPTAPTRRSTRNKA